MSRRLFDISSDFEALFDQFDEINEMDFETDENGNYTDVDGNPVSPDLLRADMLQAWYDTLEGIEEEFNFKAENCAQYIKSLKAMEADIKEEETRLKNRRAQYTRKINGLTEYLRRCMEQMNLKKIETPKAKITIRNNAPALKIEDEAGFIAMLQVNGHDDLLKYNLPEIRKADIKRRIKAGEEFPGAELAASQSLIIS